jgi:hypothetical protein
MLTFHQRYHMIRPPVFIPAASPIHYRATEEIFQNDFSLLEFCLNHLSAATIALSVDPASLHQPPAWPSVTLATLHLEAFSRTWLTHSM